MYIQVITKDHRMVLDATNCVPLDTPSKVYVSHFQRKREKIEEGRGGYTAGRPCSVSHCSLWLTAKFKGACIGSMLIWLCATGK